MVAGDSVNLELAMRASDRLGGHLVSGHVDGLAELVSRTEDARSEHFLFKTDRSLARYIAPKGSACLDGVSLTVNDVDDNQFSICIIPHTLAVTTLGHLAVGENVNLEVDLIARWLHQHFHLNLVPTQKSRAIAILQYLEREYQKYRPANQQSRSFEQRLTEAFH